MSQNPFEVVETLGQWSIMHRGEALASFPTREEAEHAAATLSTKCPQNPERREPVGPGR
jgi:hypothetical protein